MRIEGTVQDKLSDKSVQARCVIASRLAPMLNPDLPAADARAAEELARSLIDDAVIAVRVALARSLRHNRFLPRDLALRIAHDVDAVSVPFLQATEVLSEAELAELVATVGEAARGALARRARVGPELAEQLARHGEAETVSDLLRNPGARVEAPALETVYARFQDRSGVLDLLVERDGLPLDLVERLIVRVSQAASRKLAEAYGVPDFTEPAVAEARSAALLQAIAAAPEDTLAAFVDKLKARGELCPHLILRALKGGHLAFFEAAMAARGGVPLENARTLVRQGGAPATARLSQKAEIPGYLREAYQLAVEQALHPAQPDDAPPTAPAARP